METDHRAPAGRPPSPRPDALVVDTGGGATAASSRQVPRLRSLVVFIVAGQTPTMETLPFPIAHIIGSTDSRAGGPPLTSAVLLAAMAAVRRRGRRDGSRKI